MLTPLGADQPHNAARAAALGVAQVLDAATASADQVRAAVMHVITDLAMYERAWALKSGIDELPPVEATVPLLEQLGGH